MNLFRLWLRSWALRKWPDKISDEVRAQLVSEAEMQLWSGVKLGVNDWSRLSPAEQAAWTLAGQRIQAQIATTIGMACQSLESAANVASIVDNGNMAKKIEESRKSNEDRNKLIDAAERMAAKMAIGGAA
jgi:hypothetical protein